MKDENKIYTKPMYKCGICNKAYNSIEERTKCEQTCLKKQAEEAAKAAELKKQKEKEGRKAELDAELKYAAELLSNYIKDYGSYNCENLLDNIEKFPYIPIKLLNDFLF